MARGGSIHLGRLNFHCLSVAPYAAQFRGENLWWISRSFPATVERSMNTRLRDALPFVGERFGYEYDFGSTTPL
jgi:hypothetical protein